MDRRPRGRGAVLAAAFAGMVVVALVLVLRRGGEDPTVLETASASAGRGDRDVVAAVAAPADPATAPAVERRESGCARVLVLVCDSVGHPLRELDVALQRTGGQIPRRRTPILAPSGVGGGLPALNPLPELLEPFPIRPGRTNEEGRCAFDDVVPGEYRASAVCGVPAEAHVVVPDSGEVEVELRFPGDLVLVEVAVLAPSGTPPPAVTIRGGSLVEEPIAHCGSDGIQRLLLAPGEWTAVAWNQPGVEGAAPPPVRPGRPKSTSCIVARRPFHVAAGAPRVRVELPVPDLRVHVALDDGTAGPVRGLEFVLSRPADEDSEAIEIVGFARDGRSTGFGELGLGRWTVRARAPELVPGPPEIVEFGPASGPVSVSLRGTPGGVVRLVARDARGPLLVPPGTRLWLSTTAGEVVGADLETGRSGGRLDGSYGFAGVPCGRNGLRCEDPAGAGAVTFLPFRAPLEVPIDVVPGDHNRVELQLERRGLVTLRAVDAAGRDDFTLISLEVRDGERLVRSNDPKPARFRSPMPPGDYLVTVQRRDQPTRTHRLLVGTGDVEMLLRP